MLRDGRRWADSDGPFWAMLIVVLVVTLTIGLWLHGSLAWGQEEVTNVVPADVPFTLSWGPAVPPGDQYRVERQIGAGPMEHLLDTPEATCQDTLADLQAARYRVRAERTEGLPQPIVGEWSETSARILGVTRPGRPGQPGVLP